MRRFFFFLALAVLPACPALAVPLTPVEISDWREDLHFLATELPRRHPLLFEGLTPTHLTQARLDSAVADLDARIPGLARSEVIVGMEGIMALVGAGHTSINPLFDPSLGFRIYPIELHAFRDGIYVIRADRAHRDLAGARVLTVGDLPVDRALAEVGAIVSHENEPFMRAHGLAYLMMPEVLGALHITPDMERLHVVVEQNGRQRTVTLAPAGKIVPRGHDAPMAMAHPDWIDMRPASVAPPLWLSQPESRRWMEYLPASRTLYVAYQSSVPPHDGEPINVFFRRVFAAADSLAPERLVLDVRDNLGGDSFYNRQLLLGVVRRTALDQKGKLFVILGGGTYSAAQNLVNEFERYTKVTFVGEPSGSPPSFFGDHRTVRLAHSGIGLNISSLWWQAADPRDKRPFVAPEIYAEPTAADYRAGRDPALEAILARDKAPGLEKQVDDAVTAGDTARADRILEAFRSDPMNRYVDVEARVNALGYSMLSAGRPDQAAQVLALNTRAFPASANAYDSLGEIFERLGRREAAIASYRRALTISPDFASSREALRRLGAGP